MNVRTGRARSRSSTPRVLVLCAVAVVAGVLSMHVLAGAPLPSGGDGTAHAHSVVAATAVHADTEVDGGEHGAHHGLADVCLALVVALGLFLLARQALRTGITVRIVDRAGVVARRLHDRTVARPVPDLHALSVLRC